MQPYPVSRWVSSVARLTRRPRFLRLWEQSVVLCLSCLLDLNTSVVQPLVCLRATYLWNRNPRATIYLTWLPFLVAEEYEYIPPAKLHFPSWVNAVRPGAPSPLSVPPGVSFLNQSPLQTLLPKAPKSQSTSVGICGTGQNQNGRNGSFGSVKINRKTEVALNSEQSLHNYSLISPVSSHPTQRSIIPCFSINRSIRSQSVITSFTTK